MLPVFSVEKFPSSFHLKKILHFRKISGSTKTCRKIKRNKLGNEFGDLQMKVDALRKLVIFLILDVDINTKVSGEIYF
jgi:hypothetical protein